MMVSRTARKGIARLLLAAMLFTQAAVAFAACESAWRTPAHAIALAGQEMAGGNCHEQEINVNVCLAHCLGEDQSLDKPLVKVPALAVAPTPFKLAVIVMLYEVCAPQRQAMPHSAGPPLRILFQSLLI